jgi:Tfp pilus assembly protein PilZ
MAHTPMIKPDINGIRYRHTTKLKYISRGYEAFSLIDINRLTYYNSVMRSKEKNRPVKERRRSKRSSCSTAVAYATQNLSSIEYIQDISAWGVFIRTKKPVPIGEDITMTLPPLSGSNSSIKIFGEVVRATSKGIGIKFKMGIDDSVMKPVIEEN